jgi:glycosyltransferase involved in cell wall biosynthesis
VFSVVIPVYNGARFVGAAIESVLRQTHAPSDIIVIDDGSTDGTADIVQAFGRSVALIRSRHQGVSAARELGGAQALGDYVAYLDADDTWESEKLESFSQAIVNSDSPGFLISDFLRRDFETGTRLSTNTELSPSIRCHGQLNAGGSRWLTPDEAFSLVVSGYPIYPSAMVVSKAALATSGGWSSQFTRAQDFDIALRLAASFGLTYLDSCLSIVNSHSAHGPAYEYISRQLEWDLKVLRHHTTSRVFSAQRVALIQRYIVRRLLHRGDLARKFGEPLEALRWYAAAMLEPRGAAYALAWSAGVARKTLGLDKP